MGVGESGGARRTAVIPWVLDCERWLSIASGSVLAKTPGRVFIVTAFHRKEPASAKENNAIRIRFRLTSGSETSLLTLEATLCGKCFASSLYTRTRGCMLPPSTNTCRSKTKCTRNFRPNALGSLFESCFVPPFFFPSFFLLFRFNGGAQAFRLR